MVFFRSIDVSICRSVDVSKSRNIPFRAHSAKWIAKLQLFFDMTKFFFRKKQFSFIFLHFALFILHFGRLYASVTDRSARFVLKILRCPVYQTVLRSLAGDFIAVYQCLLWRYFCRQIRFSFFFSRRFRNAALPFSIARASDASIAKRASRPEKAQCGYSPCGW